MTENIEKIISRAREDFGIKDFPGNFFNYIIKDENYIDKYNLVLFKQDLGKENLGFIYYTISNRACICINYKNPIGEQNFTLAHEIGHMYLHKRDSYDENNDTLKYKNRDEKEDEANKFAAEFLYPMTYVKKDLKYIYKNGLLENGKEGELANFIDELVGRYFISYRFILLRLLFNSDFYKKNNSVMKKVSELTKLVNLLNPRNNKEMYRVIDDHIFYKPFIGILERQREIGKILVEKDEMGYNSVIAIIGKSEELEGFDETFI